MTVTEVPAFITARDTAVGILRNRNLGALLVQPDVAGRTGLRPDPQGRPAGFGIPTDTAAYDLGYSMGASRQNRANGIMSLSLLLDQGPEQITFGYCLVANDIVARSGRVGDQREAFVAGFLQARQDAVNGFDPAEGRLGVLNTTCPTHVPALTDAARQMLALRSWTDMGSGFSIPGVE